MNNTMSTGNSDLRKQSEALELLRLGDFAPVVDAAEKLFPSAIEMQPRYLALVERYVAERATLYARSPRSRVFDGTTSDEHFRSLRDIYTRSKVNGALADVLAKLVIHNTVFVAALPDALRKVRIESFCPFEAEVVPGDPLRADDIQRAKEVRLRVVMGASDEKVAYGHAVFTPTRCYFKAPNGETSPIFGNSETNPFGGWIPVIAVRAADPLRGHTMAPVDQGLLGEAIALSLAMSDLEHQIRHGQPQKILTQNPGEDDDKVNFEKMDPLPAGPRSIWIAPEGVGDVKVVTTDLKIAEMWSHIESRLRTFAIMRGLPGDTFLSKTYTSTTELRLREHARRLARMKYAEVFAPEDGTPGIETELARLIIRVHNLRAGLTLPETVSVRVQWGERVFVGGDQSAAQARTEAYKAGESHPADFIAARDNISRASAEQKVKTNVAAYLALQPRAETPA